MKHSRDVTKRLHSESYRSLVTQNVLKLAAHFRVDVFDPEIEIFIEKLPSWTNYQINEAFERCISECLFFPKLKEVLDRMPEDRAPTVIQTCPACEPDGWRMVATAPGYRSAVRCDHKPEYAQQKLPDDLHTPYENLPEWVQLAASPGLHKRERPPRFPHLIGKGILYGNTAVAKVQEKKDEPPTQK